MPARLAISGRTTFGSDLHPLDDRRWRRRDLHQGASVHRVRARHHDGRLPPDRARRHDRGDRADDRSESIRGRSSSRRPSSRSDRSRRPARSRRPRIAQPVVLDGLPEVEVFDVEARDVAPPAAPRVRASGTPSRTRPVMSTRRRAPSSSATSTSGAESVGFSVDVSHHRGRAMTAIVRTQGLVKRYDRTVAVAGIDLAIERGEIFGLVGPNGAGKTTTLRILATLLQPSAGQRRDRRLVRHPEPRRGSARPRVHAGRVRGLRRHEGLGVPRLLRALLRPPGRPAAGG